jgi:ABC-2 type transport system permease protein
MMLTSIFTRTTWERWRGVVIAVVSLGVLLLAGMAAYREVDVAIYAGLPAGFRAMLGIPDTGDAGSLAVGVLINTYGALTLAALAIAMGSAAIAGEESQGTIGLLLGNPRSRTHVLVSKAASMVLLIAVGAVGLWGVICLVAAALAVSLAGMTVGALILHLLLNSLLYGFLALAVGAWTGKRGVAAGTAAGVMVLSYFAVGLFPLIEGWANVAKAFPWYYYQTSNPLLNGVHWGHAGVLFGSSVLLLAVAVAGINRRDLRDRSVGVTLMDRLRANPTTQKVIERLAGSARVSRIWLKTLSEHQALLVITAYAMFLVVGIMMGFIFNFMPKGLMEYADRFPRAFFAAIGGGDLSTPEGFYQIENFGLMAPIAAMVVTVAVGAKALAGEEANRTMGLLLANPVTRSRIVLEKTAAMVLGAFVVGFMNFAGVALGSVIGGLGMNMGNIAATCLLATLLGLAFGALALAISAGDGRVKTAVFWPVGLAIAGHFFNGFAPLSASMAGWARLSPFYYYLTGDPLRNGMHWGHGAILAGLTVILIALSVVLFQRRDIRQTG